MIGLVCRQSKIASPSLFLAALPLKRINNIRTYSVTKREVLIAVEVIKLKYSKVKQEFISFLGKRKNKS